MLVSTCHIQLLLYNLNRKSTCINGICIHVVELDLEFTPGITSATLNDESGSLTFGDLGMKQVHLPLDLWQVRSIAHSCVIYLSLIMATAFLAYCIHALIRS